MQFRTPVVISKNENPIDYSATIISLGSCFAVNIAEKLDYYKFSNSCNPFGILFHPLAIEKLIEFAVYQKELSENDLFFHNEQWHFFDAHSDCSAVDKESLINLLHAIIQELHQQIHAATHIIITYGTAWVYRNVATNAVVANCHKLPQKQFSKELLSVEKIEQSIANTITLIQSVNTKVKFIFTVSPVRHLKDGFVENQRSKSHLLTALHLTVESLKSTSKSLYYFPSYEIMMDELRDYRFYNPDMVHPSALAIDYIWNRFSETNISSEVHSVMEEVNAIQKGLSHRSFNPKSAAHQLFLSKIQDRILLLQVKFPSIIF